VLGRWAWRGVAVGTARIDCTPPPEIEGRLTSAVRRAYSESVSEAFTGYREELEVLSAREPSIAFVGGIVDALIAGKEGRGALLPSAGEDSAPGLLREPLLHANMKCALPGCSNTAMGDDRPLRLCSGGCRGLARYCCSEHQHQHWPQHKAFCKRQR